MNSTKEGALTLLDHEFTPNSHKYKAEKKQVDADEKKVSKVVHGAAKTRKKTEVRKLADVFISEDVADVKSYLWMDVIVPAIKKALYDTVTNGFDMLLYGGARQNRKSSGTNNYVSYRNYSDRDRRDDRRDRNTPSLDFNELVFETRGDAEAVREQMEEMIDRYGFVTVADMFDMADLSAPYTGNKYGWMNIRSAQVVSARGGGYIIKLPKASPID